MRNYQGLHFQAGRLGQYWLQEKEIAAESVAVRLPHPRKANTTAYQAGERQVPQKHWPLRRARNSLHGGWRSAGNAATGFETGWLVLYIASAEMLG